MGTRLYPYSAYPCYDCGAKPGRPCRTYKAWSRRAGKRTMWHQSRIAQRARRARPPAVPVPRPLPHQLLPYARAGLNQAD